MPTTLALVVVLALLVGLALGLLGGGGSILAVPLLVYVAGLDGGDAVTTSLLVVAVTSAAAVVSHARGGRVRWRTAAVFGGAGMAGAYAGGRLAALVPDTVLLVAFALIMLATAAAMIRGRRAHAADLVPVPGRTPRLLGLGVLVGLVSGFVGAGGGFLVVPALALFGGLSMPAAVGTSLLVIAMNSAAGLVGHLGHVTLDWSLAGAVTAAAVAGSVVGGRLAGLVPAAVLRTGFGWFVLAMGGFMLVEQAPWAAVRDALTVPVVAVGLVAVAALALYLLNPAVSPLSRNRRPSR